MSTPVFDATLAQFHGKPEFWAALNLDLQERFDQLAARFALSERPEPTSLPDNADTVAYPHISDLWAERRAAAAHIAGLDHDEYS